MGLEKVWSCTMWGPVLTSFFEGLWEVSRLFQEMRNDQITFPCSFVLLCMYVFRVVVVCVYVCTCVESEVDVC